MLYARCFNMADQKGSYLEVNHSTWLRLKIIRRLLLTEELLPNLIVSQRSCGQDAVRLKIGRSIQKVFLIEVQAIFT